MSLVRVLSTAMIPSMLFACATDELELGEPAAPPADEAFADDTIDIERKYIVVMRDDVADRASLAPPRHDARMSQEGWKHIPAGVLGAVQRFEDRLSFRAERAYGAALKGFVARLDDAQLAALAADPDVELIEPDGIVSLVAQTLPWGIDRVDADISSTLAGNGSGAITNVNVYIIDTGVGSHADLNLAGHVNFAGGSNADCHGHGTHVAGTSSARDNTSEVVGVAPGTKLYGVKVLTCSGSGSTSGVIAGVDWVTANAIKPAVANMSLGGGASTSLDNAVKNSAAKGVFYALAAGNSGANACNSSPARVGAGTNNGILTVAATDSSNKETSWSNYGSCVDIWAPGASILSTKLGGGTTTMSGTSMASPHGAGAGSLSLSSHPGASPASVEAALKAAAVSTGTTSKDGRAIKLLNVAPF
jgi:aqualysin 1